MKTYCFFFVSKYDEHRAEAVVAVAIAIVVVEIEQTSIGTIIVVAPTFEHRIARVREVRVVV